MNDHKELREAIAKVYESSGNNWSAKCFRERAAGHEELFQALLPFLATPEMRECVEACEAYAKEYADTFLSPPGERVRSAGHSSIAAREPKGPWRVVGTCDFRAEHTSGVQRDFWKPINPNDPTSSKVGDVDACAAFVREQNEKERGDVRSR